jgi:hypothetical protein
MRTMVVDGVPIPLLLPAEEKRSSPGGDSECGISSPEWIAGVAVGPPRHDEQAGPDQGQEPACPSAWALSGDPRSEAGGHKHNRREGHLKHEPANPHRRSPFILHPCRYLGLGGSGSTGSQGKRAARFHFSAIARRYASRRSNNSAARGSDDGRSIAR